MVIGGWGWWLVVGGGDWWLGVVVGGFGDFRHINLRRVGFIKHSRLTYML